VANVPAAGQSLAAEGSIKGTLRAAEPQGGYSRWQELESLITTGTTIEGQNRMSDEEYASAVNQQNLNFALSGEGGVGGAATLGAVAAVKGVLGVVAKKSETLFDYTNAAGLKGILESGKLLPSLKSLNPRDVRYGNGQYLSDIRPGTMSCAQLSRCFLGQPFQGQRFKNYVEIDVSGLNVVKGREGVFVIPNEGPLDLTGRIVGSGAN